MRGLYLVWPALVLGVLSEKPLPAGEPEPPKRSITIEASPSILPKGTAWRVELQPEDKSRSHREQVTYEGKIVETSEDGLMLLVTSESRRISYTSSYATRVPFGNGLFRNVGIGQSKPKEEKKVWIPSEKIRLVQPISPKTPASVPG